MHAHRLLISVKGDSALQKTARTDKRTALITAEPRTSRTHHARRSHRSDLLAAFSAHVTHGMSTSHLYQRLPIVAFFSLWLRIISETSSIIIINVKNFHGNLTTVVRAQKDLSTSAVEYYVGHRVHRHAHITAQSHPGWPSSFHTEDQKLR